MLRLVDWPIDGEKANGWIKIYSSDDRRYSLKSGRSEIKKRLLHEKELITNLVAFCSAAHC